MPGAMSTGVPRSLDTWVRWTAAAAMAVFAMIAGAVEHAPPLRIGTTAVFLDDHVGFLNAWKNYLQARLKRPVVFVQRGSYREIQDMILRSELDVAWICGLPYVLRQRELTLVAVPVYRGKPLYQSYLIVGAEDRTTRSFSDLEGKVFAFSDPLSNSGHLVPQYYMAQTAGDPSIFFRKVFFTWGHRKVVSAVAAGLADAGSVDGYVWETLALVDPQLVRRTRVVWKSPEHGFPPIVARRSLPVQEVEAFRAVLVAMAEDPEGARLLARLNLDGFTPGDPSLFDGIRAMLRALPQLQLARLK